nr:TaqI-like C-terminal specificity domain-containing protein [Enterococcus cecorum]
MNEAFIISKEKKDELIKADPKSAEIIRPILRGRDIKKNKVDFKEIYIINVHNGYTNTEGEYVPPIDINNYPSIKEWLEFGDWNKKKGDISNFNRLKKRTDQGITPYNLRSLSYMDEFYKQKIVFSRISSSEPCFSLVNDNVFVNDTAYIITGNQIDILFNYLISDEIWFILKRFYLGGGIDTEVKVNNLLKLPVPKESNNLFLSEEEIDYIKLNI